MMPRVIKRRRTKGWRMPEGAVYVGRPTAWGNPWGYSDWVSDSRRRSVHLFERWLNGSNRPGNLEERRMAVLFDIDELRGKDLACWCVDWDGTGQPPGICHAEVLLAMANRTRSETVCSESKRSDDCFWLSSFFKFADALNQFTYVILNFFRFVAGRHTGTEMLD